MSLNTVEQNSSIDQAQPGTVKKSTAASLYAAASVLRQMARAELWLSLPENEKTQPSEADWPHLGPDRGEEQESLDSLIEAGREAVLKIITSTATDDNWSDIIEAADWASSDLEYRLPRWIARRRRSCAFYKKDFELQKLWLDI